MKLAIFASFLLLLLGTVVGQITPPVDTTPGSTTEPDTTTSSLFPVPTVETTTTTTVPTTTSTSTSTSTATTTQTLTTQDSTTSEGPSGPCDGIEEGFAPVPDDCTMFYTCVNSSISVMNICQPGQIFIEDSCVLGDPETCIPSTDTTSTQAPVTTTTTTTQTETTTSNTNTPPTPTVEPINPCENAGNGEENKNWEKDLNIFNFDF
jgi:hypothetical protein